MENKIENAKVNPKFILCGRNVFYFVVIQDTTDFKMLLFSAVLCVSAPLRLIMRPIIKARPRRIDYMSYRLGS